MLIKSNKSLKSNWPLSKEGFIAERLKIIYPNHMKKTILAYCLAFLFAFLTIVAVQTFMAACTPMLHLNPTYKSLFDTNHMPCGFISRAIKTAFRYPIMSILTSILGDILFFLIANVLYFKLFQLLLNKKKPQ